MNTNKPFTPSYGSFFILTISAAVLYFFGKESGYKIIFWVGAVSFVCAAVMFLYHNGNVHPRSFLASILCFAIALAFFQLSRV